MVVPIPPRQAIDSCPTQLRDAYLQLDFHKQIIAEALISEGTLSWATFMDPGFFQEFSNRDLMGAIVLLQVFPSEALNLFVQEKYPKESILTKELKKFAEFVTENPNGMYRGKFVSCLSCDSIRR